MPPTGTRPGAATESLRLGVALTIVLLLAFFGFLATSAFMPSLLARPIVAGGTTTWAFACGLGVIGLGVALTGLYVLAANRAEARS